MSFTRAPLRNARILEQEARGFYRPQPSSVGLWVASIACVVGILAIAWAPVIAEAMR